MLVYTYYGDPWKLKSGDHVRIHAICKALGRVDGKVIVYDLSHLVDQYMLTYEDGVIYVNIPRRIYGVLSKIVRWENKEDLNVLIKLTHYIDEFLTTIKLAKELKCSKVAYVFGSMTLYSFFAQMLGFKGVFVYDPLANYAQTLHLRSRKDLKELLKYGLYLVLHKLQLKSSNYMVYPSNHDLKNAVQMFKLNPNKAFLIPNPYPICYESIDEYEALRKHRRNFDIPYFILLAGGRGRGNEEAVKLSIEVFNELPSNRFRLFITGPWRGMERYVKNPAIKILGIVHHDKIKKMLAMADYGLAPIFSHAAGTFLKVLAYIAAGLNIIASPYAVQGVNTEFTNVILVQDVKEYKDVVRWAIEAYPVGKRKTITCKPVLCSSAYKDLETHLENFLSYLHV